MILDLTATALRWRGRRTTWRPLREPFDPARFYVEPLLKTGTARAFVASHHYSHTTPVALASYGLFERVTAFQKELVGVALFSIPIQPRAAAAYGAGEAPFCDLGRFLLLDHVGSNAETYFLARALRFLQAERRSEGTSLDLVVAYSDPVPRTDRAGQVLFNGHFGGIYRDSSALFLGRTKPRTLWLTDDGTAISDRALSKLRNDDCGAAYAYQGLIRHGAPKRCPGESGHGYVKRALTEGPFRALRHRGNFIYGFPLGSQRDRRDMRNRLHTLAEKPTKTDIIEYRK
jgi:hypothetical protein